MEGSTSHAAHEEITDEGVEGMSGSLSTLILGPWHPAPEPAIGLFGGLMMGFMNQRRVGSGKHKRK